MKTRWILGCLNVIAILLIAASLFVLLSVVLTPAGQVPQVLGYSVFRVMTGSMEPEIPENALLLVRKTAPQNLQPGDVISFFSPDPTLGGAVNTHRVVRVEEEGDGLWFYTKGDANLIEDAYPVHENMVVGRMVFVSGVLGMAVSLLTNPLVFGIVVMLPLVVILLMNLWKTVRLAMDMAKQEEETAVRQAMEEWKAKQQSQQKE